MPLVLRERAHHPPQDRVSLLARAGCVPGAHARQQRTMHTGQSLQTAALLGQAPQSDASADVPQQRVPDQEERTVAAALDQATMKPQRVLDVLLCILAARGSLHG